MQRRGRRNKTEVFSFRAGRKKAQRKDWPLRKQEGTKKKAPIRRTGPLEFIPAATYVPTQLPVQYHRPGEA
jgi:hypothetical protein